MSLDRYVGLPFVDKGRSEDGCDCYGLLWLVILRELGVELPRYDDRYVTGADRREIDALIADELAFWESIPAGDEQTFDAVLMRDAGCDSHVGIVVGGGLMLHVAITHAARIERYRSPMWRRRIVGFYRYRPA